MFEIARAFVSAFKAVGTRPSHPRPRERYRWRSGKSSAISVG
jgi:hypothetical protein